MSYLGHRFNRLENWHEQKFGSRLHSHWSPREEYTIQIGTGISGVLNLVPGGPTLPQPGGTAQPLYNRGGINGFPAMQFSPTTVVDQMLATVTAVGGTTLGIIFVGQFASTSNNTHRWVSCYNNTSGGDEAFANGCALERVTTGENFMAQRNSVLAISPNGSIRYNVPFVGSVVYDSAFMYLCVNGIVIAKTAVTGTFNWDRVWVAYGLDGFIGDILIATQMELFEMTAQSRRFMRKYRIDVH